MHFDDLWLLHQQLTKVLAKKINAEKVELDGRLARLSTNAASVKTNAGRSRRKYPKVMPKYFNPEMPVQTWSGRGKQPRWFASALRSGHKIEELRIASKEVSPRRERLQMSDRHRLPGAVDQSASGRVEVLLAGIHRKLVLSLKAAPEQRSQREQFRRQNGSKEPNSGDGNAPSDQIELRACGLPYQKLIG